MALGYDKLDAHVRQSAGIRARTPLEPLGGPHDKVFPPTYAVEDRAITKYAIEYRIVDGHGQANRVESVVLSSVAATAHTYKNALREAWEAGILEMPLVGVDFDTAGLPEFGLITDLDSPHGVYDAIQRDSLDGEVPFRYGDIGRAITTASPRNASALFVNAPVALLTGSWDSTGPRGGLGSKFERAITGEIVATNVALGVKTSSRIDPLGIQRIDVYKTADDDWTLDKAQAKAGGKAIRPSEVNHGNVLPTIDARAGGITAESIAATTVISFIQLRRLHFPTGPDGAPLPRERRGDVAHAARTTLAALGLAAAALAFEGGFDLRSRCVLAPTSNLTFEVVGRGGEIETFELTGDDALALVAEAARRTADAGLPWRAGLHTLQPTDRLVELVRRSQAKTSGEAAADAIAGS